ncbi:hypothetical protein F511_25824 [Dorcoceras hygrometricum]|uniref:Spindle pole body component 110-like n=1 Tax=Dorcoceras hygrometricum TaxID=472368 RepID=A0A2Z7CD49_9LAMI|nr:hypothetical protein F511_25824 [Dorcoceras hygrometricum]
MVDDIEELFNFYNFDSTLEDLLTALNDMAKGYKKLSQSFKEVKAKKESLATKPETVSSDDLQTALSNLKTKNEDLRSRSHEMLNENQCLAEIINFWAKSSASLQKLQGALNHPVISVGWAMRSIKAIQQRHVLIHSWISLNFKP